MTPFEDELKKALARHEPSSGFTERVLAQVSPAKPAAQTPNRITWRLAAAAAAALFLVGGIAYQQHEHQIEGEAAKHKLLIAIRIAGSKLQEAQQYVIEIENPEATQ
jgi:hypothetical protein